MREEEEKNNKIEHDKEDCQTRTKQETVCVCERENGVKFKTRSWMK